jgi:O-antigen/teichoic acid export membrane protein
VEIALRTNCYAVCAVYLPLLLFGNGIVQLVFSDRWLPAVPLLFLMLWSWLLRSIFATGATALNALGKTTLNFWLHLVVAAGSWTLVLVLVPARGFVGLGEAWLLAALPTPLVVVYLARILPVRLVRNLVAPLSLFVFAFSVGQLYLFAIHASQTGPALISGTAIVLVIFALGVGLLERPYLHLVAAFVRSLLKRRQQPEEAFQSA